MYMYVASLIVLWLATESEAIVCVPSIICKDIEPLDVNECAGGVIEKGGFCGCTDACAKIEGEACTAQGWHIFGVPGPGKCDKGFNCVQQDNTRNGYGKCVQDMKTTTTTAPVNVRTCDQVRKIRLISFAIWRGQWTPKCAANGIDYQPTQCDNTGKCFCVTKKGEKIAGTSVQGMHRC